MLSIRWGASFGDPSPIGTALASFMLHLVYAVFLVICIWVAFDPPVSPRGKGFGLTLYYLGALSVGYYSGYFLLVFGKKPVAPPQRRRPSPFGFLNIPVVACVWLLFILAGVGLIYKNAPQLQAANDDTFRRYTSLVEESLPRSGGILLSDDPRRLILEQVAFARDGRMKDFIPIETQSLKYPSYHKFLHRQFPQKWPDTIAASEETNSVSLLHLIGLLTTHAKTNELYYLHPSFGYYFEQFYLEPHGLVYKLKTLPSDTLLPPLPDKNEIAGNETFWSQAETLAFSPIERALAVPKPGSPQSWVKKQFTKLHVAQEQNPNAVVAGSFYSRSLDFWGVKMQRAGALVAAAAHFEMAEKLNPDNVVAQINLQFNHSLQTGENVPVDLTKVTLDQFKLHSWNEVFNVDGPFDEPSFCFEDGVVLVQGKLFRQAVASFTRVRQLAPDNLVARLWLGQIYDLARLPDRALEAIQDVRGQPEKFSLMDTNEIQLTLIEAAAYFEKKDTARATQLLETEISNSPTNDILLAAAAQFYTVNGLFHNALAVIDRRLQLSPDDPNLLFDKGYVCVQLRAYDDAIAALTRVLSLQQGNKDALYNRAIAYYNSGRFDESRADYMELNQTVTNSYQIAYGLGQIAWLKHETNEAVKNYTLYLANTNISTNTDTARMIIQRLHGLKGKSP
jgi:tetratricopeptide (TPR) repeat protein